MADPFVPGNMRTRDLALTIRKEGHGVVVISRDGTPVCPCVLCVRVFSLSLCVLSFRCLTATLCVTALCDCTTSDCLVTLSFCLPSVFFEIYTSRRDRAPFPFFSFYFCFVIPSFFVVPLKHAHPTNTHTQRPLCRRVLRRA